MRRLDRLLLRWLTPLPSAIILLALVVLLGTREGGSGALLGYLSKILDAVPVRLQSGSPGMDDPPGSGVAVRTDVIALWIPQVLVDLSEAEPGPPPVGSPEALAAALRRRGLEHGWYALSYRNTQVNGGSAQLTQIRRLGELNAHPVERQSILDVLAARSGHARGRDGALAELHIIPERLLGEDPPAAFARLLAAPEPGAGGDE